MPQHANGRVVVLGMLLAWSIVRTASLSSGTPNGSTASATARPGCRAAFQLGGLRGSMAARRGCTAAWQRRTTAQHRTTAARQHGGAALQHGYAARQHDSAGRQQRTTSTRSRVPSASCALQNCSLKMCAEVRKLCSASSRSLPRGGPPPPAGCGATTGALLDGAPASTTLCAWGRIIPRGVAAAVGRAARLFLQAVRGRRPGAAAGWQRWRDSTASPCCPYARLVSTRAQLHGQS